MSVSPFTVRVFHTVWSDGSKNKKAFDLEYVDAGHFAFVEDGRGHD